MNNLYSIHSILYNAKKEIEYIIDCSNEQARAVNKERRSLKRALEDVLAYIENPGHNPDLEAMTENIRLQLK